MICDLYKKICASKGGDLYGELKGKDELPTMLFNTRGTFNRTAGFNIATENAKIMDGIGRGIEIFTTGALAVFFTQPPLAQ